MSGMGESPALALEGVTVRFGGIVALSDVSLQVTEGETVGLIGPNGAGKTTLIDVIAGNRRPDPGEVLLYGERVTRLPAVRRAHRGLSRTFQTLSLFDGMTVWEHVLLGYAAGAPHGAGSGRFVSQRRRLEDAARSDTSELGPVALMDKLGLASVADELASTQAVGVVRMVDLARALAARPRVLLLDEPVSGLPEPEARTVAAVIQALRKEHSMALLVIEHNLEFARLVSDRMIAVDFGKVIAEGPPDEVLGSDSLRVAYFGEDADAEEVKADPATDAATANELATSEAATSGEGEDQHDVAQRA
jgi:branched-chain amino acid transport system ATP-binding protein